MWLSIDQIMEVKLVIFAGYSKENSMEKHTWYFVNKINIKYNKIFSFISDR